MHCVASFFPNFFAVGLQKKTPPEQKIKKSNNLRLDSEVVVVKDFYCEFNTSKAPYSLLAAGCAPYL